MTEKQLLMGIQCQPLWLAMADLICELRKHLSK